MQKETALTVRGVDLDRDELQPHSYDAVVQAAKDIVKSGLWKGTIDTEQQAVMIIQMGRELGLRMVQAANMLVVIKGKVGLYAKAKVSLVRQAGHRIWCSHDPTSARTPKTERHFAEWKAIRDGIEVSATFSMEEAEQLGLTERKKKGTGEEYDGEWKKQPAQMLVWRAASRLCDREFADILLGLQSVESIDDEPPTPASDLPRARIESIETPAIEGETADDETWPSIRAQFIQVLGAKKFAELVGCDPELVEQAPPVNRNSDVAQKLRAAAAEAKRGKGKANAILNEARESAK